MEKISQTIICQEKNIFSTFMPRMCLYDSNIENQVLRNILDRFHVYLQLNNNNEFLKKKHESQLIGSTQFPKINATRYNNHYAYGRVMDEDNLITTIIMTIIP